MTTIHTIDATDKVFGRIASQVAKILIGKTNSDYTPNKVADVSVRIVNASKTKMSEARLNDTLHERYSGHPGGLKMKTNARVIEKHDWAGLYEMAIYNMLPSNKLRPIMMKHLIITE